MTCDRCGNLLPDAVKACPYCGVQFTPAPPYAQETYNQEPLTQVLCNQAPVALGPQVIEAEPKKKKKKIKTVLIVVGTIICVIIVAYMGLEFFIGNYDMPEDYFNYDADYVVSIIDSKIVQSEYDDEMCLLVTYSFTNYSVYPQSFCDAVIVVVYQNYVFCEYGLYISDDFNGASMFDEIESGVTTEVQESYKLLDATSPVKIEIYDETTGNTYLLQTIEIS